MNLSDKLRAQFFNALLEDAILAFGSGDKDTSARLLGDARYLFPDQNELTSWLSSCIDVVKYDIDDIQWRAWHTQPKHESLMRQRITEKEDKRDINLLQKRLNLSNRPSLMDIGKSLFPVEPLPGEVSPIYMRMPNEDRGSDPESE